LGGGAFRSTRPQGVSLKGIAREGSPVRRVGASKKMDFRRKGGLLLPWNGREGKGGEGKPTIIKKREKGDSAKIGYLKGFTKGLRGKRVEGSGFGKEA